MSATTTERDPTTTRRRRALVASAVIVALALGAYLMGRNHSATTIRHGRALSATGVIGVEVDGSNHYTIPLDVAWVGSDGGYRSNGRPECVPPVGIGTIPVTFATVKVKDPDGYERDLTVWVDCTGWNPDEDLTPRQTANLKENLPGE